jgi:hypothetical protein
MAQALTLLRLLLIAVKQTKVADDPGTRLFPGWGRGPGTELNVFSSLNSVN